MTKGNLLWAIAVCGLIFAGCGKSDDESSSGGASSSAEAKTPKEAAMNFVKSFQNNDKALFFNTVELQRPEDRDFASAAFDAMAAMASFKNAMVKAYGKDAVKDSVPVPTTEDVDKANITIDPKDPDKASGKVGDDSSDKNFVRKGGAWKVLMKDVPPAEQQANMKKVFAAIVKGVAELKPKIGQQGMTAEKINEEFGAIMGKAMMPEGAPASNP